MDFNLSHHAGLKGAGLWVSPGGLQPSSGPSSNLAQPSTTPQMPQAKQVALPPADSILPGPARLFSIHPAALNLLSTGQLSLCNGAIVHLIAPNQAGLSAPFLHIPVTPPSKTISSQAPLSPISSTASLEATATYNEWRTSGATPRPSGLTQATEKEPLPSRTLQRDPSFVSNASTASLLLPGSVFRAVPIDEGSPTVGTANAEHAAFGRAAPTGAAPTQTTHHPSPSSPSHVRNPQYRRFHHIDASLPAAFVPASGELSSPEAESFDCTLASALRDDDPLSVFKHCRDDDDVMTSGDTRTQRDVDALMMDADAVCQHNDDNNNRRSMMELDAIRSARGSEPVQRQESCDLQQLFEHFARDDDVFIGNGAGSDVHERPPLLSWDGVDGATPSPWLPGDVGVNQHLHHGYQAKAHPTLIRTDDHPRKHPPARSQICTTQTATVLAGTPIARLSAAANTISNPGTNSSLFNTHHSGPFACAATTLGSSPAMPSDAMASPAAALRYAASGEGGLALASASALRRPARSAPTLKPKRTASTTTKKRLATGSNNKASSGSVKAAALRVDDSALVHKHRSRRESSTRRAAPPPPPPRKSSAIVSLVDAVAEGRDSTIAMTKTFMLPVARENNQAEANAQQQSEKHHVQASSGAEGCVGAVQSAPTSNADVDGGANNHTAADGGAAAAAADGAVAASPESLNVVPTPAASPTVMEPVECTFLLAKRLTQTDVSRLGRIILPRAAVEQALPKVNDPKGMHLTLWDRNGNGHAVVLKYWLNGPRPVSKRMYLLDGCAGLVETLALRVGDAIVLYRSADGRFALDTHTRTAASRTDDDDVL